MKAEVNRRVPPEDGETNVEPSPEPLKKNMEEDPDRAISPKRSSSITSKDSKSSLKRKSPLRTKSSKSEEPLVSEDSGVVIGNFHAYETDDVSEVLLPRLVNGCSRVLPKQAAEENNGYSNGNSHSNNNECQKPDIELLDSDTKCGIGCCQPLANTKTFLVVFCLTTVLQGMFYTYFASVLTTIQKLYRISSQVTGIIMSATEIGQICGSMFLAYYGGSGHRPRWIAWGVLLFSLCTFLCAVPHIIYVMGGSSDLFDSNFDSKTSNNFNVCEMPNSVTSSSMLEVGSSGNFSSNSTLSDLEGCQDTSNLTNLVLVLFFVSLIGVGIGQMAVVNLGIPYIDDNVDNKDSPMYFATTSAVRILGPTLGFVLGSVCTRVYVTLEQPGFGTSDPRWVGAWWLGHIIVSSLLFVTGFILFLFPRRFAHAPSGAVSAMFSPSTTVSSIGATMDSPSPAPDGKVRTNLSALLRPDSAPSSLHSSTTNIAHPAAPARGAEGAREKPQLKDFPAAVYRQLQNPVLVLRTASSVLHILPIAGLYTFLPKYLETQFRLTVHMAAMLSGTGGILLMGVGILFSGFYIRYTRPSARFIAAWIALTALLYGIGMVVLMFIGCEQDDFVGLVTDAQTSEMYFMAPCNRSCSCDDSTFAPVCTASGTTHFSACHLGCSTATTMHDTNAVQFSDCSCLPGADPVLKVCDSPCDALKWYILVFAIFVIIHSTSEVGGTLITLRCCRKEDKAMALGLISLAIGLFGNMPCPIIYGGVVDAACIQWRTTCGRRGDCQLYDTRFFRLVFHGVTAAMMLLAFFVDVAVWVKSKDIVLQPDLFEEEVYYSPCPPEDPSTERPQEFRALPSSSSTDCQEPPASNIPSSENPPPQTVTVFVAARGQCGPHRNGHSKHSIPGALELAPSTSTASVPFPTIRSTGDPKTSSVTVQLSASDCDKMNNKKDSNNKGQSSKISQSTSPNKESSAQPPTADTSQGLDRAYKSTAL